VGGEKLPYTLKIQQYVYSNLLTRLDEKIREERPGLQKKKITFHQDNARRPQKCFGNGKIKGSAL
jgi:hypothetical protein